MEIDDDTLKQLLRMIVELAVKSQLPAMYFRRVFVDDGGLMSYGVSLNDLDRRAATYVDKILKGRKPADLPVEQPTKFELVINLKTAKHSTLVDGEIVALDESGRVSFNLLQHHRSKAQALLFYVFDVLVHRGRSVMNLPLSTRRELNICRWRSYSPKTHYFKLPGDEIVPVTVNEPTPLFGPVNTAEPINVPLPVAPANRPVPPVTA